MSSHLRSLSWIVVPMGGLALFLIFASWVLISYPIGASVHEYFYGVESVERLDLSISQNNETFVDHNVSDSGLQSSTISSSLSTDTNKEHSDTMSNSQVPFKDSTSSKFPQTNELNDLEKSTIAASNSQVPLIDVVNNSLPTHSNQVASSVEGGTSSPNVTSNVRISETVSVDSISNSNPDTSTTSNVASVSRDSGCNFCLFSLHNLVVNLSFHLPFLYCMISYKRNIMFLLILLFWIPVGVKISQTLPFYDFFYSLSACNFQFPYGKFSSYSLPFIFY